MKFTVRIQYGLQALLELALNHGSGPIQIKEIADNQNVPIKFLEQILVVLKRGGLVASTRGRTGGYNLARRPSEISVKDLIEVLEGPIELTNKKMKKSPVLFEAFDRIQRGIKSDLAKLTLDELALKERAQERVYNYSI